jgi:hypothetical protein
MSSNGITAVIAEVLRNDVVSVPASGFIDNPALISASASAVPPWTYTCLKDLWGMQDKTNDEWSRYIVDVFGLGRSSGNTIDVTVFRTIDQCDTPAGAFPKSNTFGAKMSEVHIMFKLPDRVTDSQKEMLYFSSMRIQRLLDWNYRLNTTKQAPITSNDITIRNDCNIQLYWIGDIRPQDSKDWMTMYYAFYTQVCI